MRHPSMPSPPTPPASSLPPMKGTFGCGGRWLGWLQDGPLNFPSRSGHPRPPSHTSPGTWLHNRDVEDAHQLWCLPRAVRCLLTWPGPGCVPQAAPGDMRHSDDPHPRGQTVLLVLYFSASPQGSALRWSVVYILFLYSFSLLIFFSSCCFRIMTSVLLSFLWFLYSFSNSSLSHKDLPVMKPRG